ncbi:MAG: metallophosphoesterase [Planctomycetes bacterium]|nr:metallophosphoesterase [Planctomycetota bacterium]
MIEIAHVSDLHFAWAPGDAGVPAHGFLNKRLVGYANLRFHRKNPQAIADALGEDLRAHPPDHLAITGDLTNLSLPGEFRRARDWIESLELPPERVSVIPGNHDAYVPEGLDLFEETFAPWLPGPSWPREQRAGPAALFGTSSSLPVPWFRAWGALGPEQLDSLSRLIDASDAPLKAVLVHHPPVLGNGRPDKPTRNNRDGARLIEVCRGRVDLILCGHTHEAFDYTFPGERPLRVFCAGSTTMAPKTHGQAATYNRYRSLGGRLNEIVVRGFDPQLGAFLSLSSRRPAPAGLTPAPS